MPSMHRVLCLILITGKRERERHTVVISSLCGDVHAEKVLQRATQDSPWLGRKNTENRQRESLCSGAEAGGWLQGVLEGNSGSLRSHGNLTRGLGGGL